MELKCRLFTSPKLLREELREEPEKKVREAVARSKLKKCGKPLTIPIRDISIVITKTSDISVTKCVESQQDFHGDRLENCLAIATVYIV